MECPALVVRLVIFGLAVSPSWANGYSTLRWTRCAALERPEPFAAVDGAGRVRPICVTSPQAPSGWIWGTLVDAWLALGAAP